MPEQPVDRSRRLLARRYHNQPVYYERTPDVAAGCANMLEGTDAALLIGDPALRISANRRFQTSDSGLRYFDLAELWHQHTGLGFVFAMWMTRRESVSINFAAARDEGLAHIDEIVANYENDIRLSRDEMRKYLSQNISYSIDDSMKRGMELYFKLAARHGLIEQNRSLNFI